MSIFYDFRFYLGSQDYLVVKVY